MRQRRGGFTLPGPNCVWSVDGYAKLRDFGFDIYAAIDAYSRFVIWSYCGVSASTERSVLEQYMAAVKDQGFIPQVVRSDKGSETTSAAAAHFLLLQASKGVRRLKLQRNPDGTIEFVIPDSEGRESTRIPVQLNDFTSSLFGPNRELLFPDVWTFGKSTKNQRIEAWWQHLHDGRTWFWIVSHGYLSSNAYV
jgi:hypothetical protein